VIPIGLSLIVWWAGLAVLCAYTAIVVRMALRRAPAANTG
jgi:hypothetical protein